MLDDWMPEGTGLIPEGTGLIPLAVAHYRAFRSFSSGFWLYLRGDTKSSSSGMAGNRRVGQILLRVYIILSK